MSDVIELYKSLNEQIEHERQRADIYFEAMKAARFKIRWALAPPNKGNRDDSLKLALKYLEAALLVGERDEEIFK